MSADFTVTKASMADLMARLSAAARGLNSGLMFTATSDTGGNLFVPDTFVDEVTTALTDTAIAAQKLANLQAFVTSTRYAKMAGGVTISGAAVKTDDYSRNMLTGSVSLAQQDPTTTIDWKNPDGSFSTITATQILAIGVAVAKYVNACFTAEKNIAAAVTAGTVTDNAGVLASTEWPSTTL